MKILITGGFGFLGSRLAKHFMNQNHDVTLASRSYRKLTGNHSEVNFFRVDWGDQKNLDKMVDNQDVVIHAAGINARNCLDNPDAANSFNIDVTPKLMQAVESAGVSNFFFLSTIHVYGSQLSGSITEDSEIFDTHPYASSNLAAEKFINNFDSFNNMRAIVFRLANNFGYPAFPNKDCWSLVINDLCLQAIANRKMVINGSGEDLRDFMPIDVLCKIFDDFILGKISSLNHSTYNICSSKSLSIMDVAKKIQSFCLKEFNFKPQIITMEAPNKELFSSFTIKSKLKSLSKHNFDRLFNQELLSLLKYCDQNKDYLNQTTS